jgi:hypothetical protein
VCANGDWEILKRLDSILIPAILTAALLAINPSVGCSDDLGTGSGTGKPAGLFAKGNHTVLPKLTLSSGEPLLGEGKLVLKSGGYYDIEIEADGSQQLEIAGPEFFRNIWINTLSIDGIEIRPIGIDSISFDDAATAAISFIAIKPGTYFLQVPNRESQKVEIVIE